ncbi:MAG: EAL domain-containing protein [Acidimicrobiia bacterium]
MLPAVVLVLGTAGSFAVSAWEHHAVEQQRRDRFQRESGAIVSSISGALRLYEAINASIRDTVLKPDGTFGTKDDFKRLTDSLVLEARFPGTFGIAWADSVPRSKLPIYQADPTVPRSQLLDLNPSVDRDRAAVVRYAGPDVNMDIARGVDARVFPPLARALDRAMDTGTAHASERFPLPLREGPEKRRKPIVVFIVRPVYSTATAPATVAERRTSLVGYAGIVLDMQSFVPASTGVNGSRYAVAAYDTTDDAKHRLGKGPLAASTKGQHRRDVLHEFGRTWIVRIDEARVTVYPESDLGQSFLVAGLVLTAFVLLVVSLLTRSERRALLLVRRATSELSRRASEDALTGLANRSELMTRLELARKHAVPGDSGPTLFFLDLDRFKLINDSLGHVVGDELLVEVAERLRSASRERDVVVRFGGDEFVVMVDDARSEEDVHRIAARLQQAFVEPVRIGDHAFDMTASIGIARTITDDWTPASLIRDADVAMYDAKHRTPGTASVFEQSLGRRASDRLAMVNGFGEALARDEFELVYQPIVQIADGSLLGFEALLRWHHPERGTLAAAEFIELAEESGAILAIGRWVLHSACAAAATWSRSCSASVWVNISGKQLARASFAGEVMDALVGSGLAPSLLRLEVTESVLTTDPETAVASLEALCRIGVRVAVDDFGNGYSSFAQLRQLPMDVLKLDRSFIRHLGVDQGDHAIVRAMIELAHALGMITVAEGVEHGVQARALAALGCDALQGWLTGVPSALGDLGAPDGSFATGTFAGVPGVWARDREPCRPGAVRSHPDNPSNLR